jgi:uncharacterized protein DUF1688
VIAARSLLCAAAVRARCGEVLGYIERGDSPWFVWQPDRLQTATAITVATIRDRFPDLLVPFHSRWRHFEAGHIDRWGAVVARHGLAADAIERARTMFDLVIPSVLLDAGAGASWHFREAEAVFGRSEGLAIASLRWFCAGGFATDPARPLRADAAALERIDAASLARAFQVSTDNPLPGIANRAALLARLGSAAQAAPAQFGRPARLGNLVDHFLQLAQVGRLTAERILQTLLELLGPVWPGRLRIDGIELGDTWRHAAADGGLVPFHKLTQWLAYSLLEPLACAGLQVDHLDGLTGLPEYRNGGLLLDTGLLALRDPALAATPLRVDHAAVVEWRAATVVGLDRIAEAVRRELDLTPAQFPLARVLEGGTWAAGRRLAVERRPGAAPPLQIDSDGTVF